MNFSQCIFRTANILIFIVLSAVAIMISGCQATLPSDILTDDSRAQLQGYIESSAVTDDRGRFREIYCAVLEERKEVLPDYRACDAALRSTGVERGATGQTVHLEPVQSRYLVLLVPGLGWNCFEHWLDLEGTVPNHLASVGFELRTIPVDGLASTQSNAALIADYVASLPPEDADRRIILAGYSKGAPDILSAIVAFPALATKVDAIVSIAGAVGGSPLSEDATQAQANMLTMVPGSTCEEEDGDNDAIASLQPSIRQQWLKDNPLPDSIHYYSAVTFPEPERVSWILRNSYVLLGETDLRNDTQLVVFDQMIPQSKVFAVVNADHWAIAVPIQRHHPILGSTLVNRNDYPREAFMEAILRYVEEDLQEMGGP